MRYTKVITVIALLALLGVGGCSVASNLPTIIAASTGLTKHSLRDQSPYSSYVGKSFRLKPDQGAVVSLKKFENGRYFVDFSPKASGSTLLVCSLIDGEIHFIDIFKDDRYSSVLYSAKATCANGTQFNAPLNHWSSLLTNVLVLQK